MKESTTQETGKNCNGLEPVFCFLTKSNTQSVQTLDAFPATEEANLFRFSRPGDVHLYQVNGLVMGIMRPSP